MARKFGGRGLESVENEYKNTKIEVALKRYCNADPTMAAVRSVEKLAVQNGRHSIIKDAKKYAEELDLQLWLNFPNPTAVADGKKVEAGNLQSPPARDTINGIWREMARKTYQEQMGRRES